MAADESNPEPSEIPAKSAVTRSYPSAWQPLTPAGVAAFSRARVGRLFWVQLIVALLVIASVFWFCISCWSPVIREAIRQLPETGLIENQQLSSPRVSTLPLAENPFLAVVMDMEDAGTPGISSHLRIELRRRSVSFCTVFGCHVMGYPAGKTIQFNQPELESWRAAWQLVVYTGIGIGLLVWLFGSWLVLATIYSPIVRLYSFFKDRQITLVGSWKLAAACLLPGALLVGSALVLYGFGVIDLIRLLVLWAFHLVVGWVYLFVSPLRLPRTSDALPSAGRNPFGSEGQQGEPIIEKDRKSPSTG